MSRKITRIISIYISILMSFCLIIFPSNSHEINKDNIDKAGIDAAESFSEILDILFLVDKQLILDPWWDNDTTKCIGKNDEPPSCKSCTGMHVDVTEWTAPLWINEDILSPYGEVII